MNAVNATLDPVAGLKHAKRVVGFMRIGVMPSASNADSARQAVVDAVDRVEGTAAAVLLRTLGAIKAGLAPSVDLCRQAEQEAVTLMEGLRDKSTQRQRLVERGR